MGETTGASTIPEADLPWRTRGGGSGPPIPHLVIMWSLEEPERIGEAIPVTERCVLGRGGKRDNDPAPRAQLFRQRPGVSLPMHPLESSRISRVQLDITPRKDGRLEIKNVGQVALLADGEPVDTCVVSAGSTVAIKNALTFLVAPRKIVLDALRGGREGSTRFDFGAPDAHGIVGESPVAWQLRDELAFAGSAPGHVLLRGPSGVGKELAAKAIHGYSDRRTQAFI